MDYDFAPPANDQDDSEFQYQNENLEVDLYVPPGNQSKPFLFFLHGGAFIKGSKDDAHIVTLCSEFARRGYIVASADYRLLSDANPSFVSTGYLAIQDALNALEFSVILSEKWNIDKQQIVVGGISAGAITALNMCFWDVGEKLSEEHEQLESIYGKLDRYCKFKKPDIKIILNISGAVMNTDIIDSKSHCLSYHGDKDNIIPYSYGLPFENFSPIFNKVFTLAESYYREHYNGILEIPRITDMFGSSLIHLEIEKQDPNKSKLYTLEGDDHELMFAVNGDLNSTGKLLVDDMARQFYNILYESKSKTEQKATPETKQYTYDELYELVSDGALNILRCNANPNEHSRGSSVKSSQVVNAYIDNNNFIFEGTYDAQNYGIDYTGSFIGSFDINSSKYNNLMYTIQYICNNKNVTEGCLNSE